MTRFLLSIPVRLIWNLVKRLIEALLETFIPEKPVDPILHE